MGQDRAELEGGGRREMERPGAVVPRAWSLAPVVRESMDVGKDVYLMHKKLGISRLNT